MHSVTITDDLADVYRDLHRHPELAFQEARTAGIVAQRLTALGFDVTTGVGVTGVVGILRNGEGPTALLRADMDALPVEESTGLDYASTQRGTDVDGHDVPLMHACGHDVHVTCLLGAAAELAGDTMHGPERSCWCSSPLRRAVAGLRPWLLTASTTGSADLTSSSASMSPLSRLACSPFTRELLSQPPTLCASRCTAKVRTARAPRHPSTPW